VDIRVIPDLLNPLLRPSCAGQAGRLGAYAGGRRSEGPAPTQHGKAIIWNHFRAEKEAFHGVAERS
jgi:hypothetical protein